MAVELLTYDEYHKAHENGLRNRTQFEKYEFYLEFSKVALEAKIFEETVLEARLKPRSDEVPS